MCRLPANASQVGKEFWVSGVRSTHMMVLFVILIVAWLLGMVSSYTLGGFIHLLLLLAIAVILIRVIQGRRPV